MEYSAVNIQDGLVSTIDWNNIEPSVQPGTAGIATSRTFKMGNIQIRMVDFSAGYLADGWCDKGHVVQVLEGELLTELADGRKFISTAGTGFTVADGLDAHRGSTEKGCKLLIID
jgi:hypothetical protein